MEVVKRTKTEEEYAIKPQAVTPAVDTSSWPLLLKNYEKRMWQAPAILAIGARAIPEMILTCANLGYLVQCS